VPGACELVLLQLLDEDGEGRPAVAGAGRWIHESDVEAGVTVRAATASAAAIPHFL
jgi:hypothetical protein